MKNNHKNYQDKIIGYCYIMEDNKKWMHKETERQRRQEMTNLCTSLRSLLPLEYIKGKRSISDHVNEAINYINHLQNKVKQLEAKKEDLMKVSNLNENIPQNGSSSTNSTNLQPFVIVQPFPGGLEIVCSYTSKKCLFPLSRVLDMLLKEGLNVISSNCTKIDGRFIYTIRSEDPIIGFDYSQLQRKLTDAISCTSLQESSSEPGIHNILR